MDRPLYPDDIVAKFADESPAQLGVIERTHGDVDTHEPLPGRNEDDPIRHDREISQAAFRKFMKDGVPPRGTVMVRWENTQSAQLLPTVKLKLLDRSLLIGDVVKRSAKDAMSGVVINTFTKCMLQPMYDVKYRDGHLLKGLLPPGPLSPGIKHAATGKPPLIINVPASELQYAESPTEEDLVIYKDWIGRVEAATRNITIKLVDNCVVEIDDETAEHADGALDAFNVGDIAVTKKGNLRTGKWIFGQYNPNTHPIGTVVQTRLVAAEVQWLQRRIGSVHDAEPPSLLERDELESNDFHIYDRTRRPVRQVAADAALETISNSEIDVRLGVRVRFTDLAGACVKYDGSTSQGNIPRIDRATTLGYDINVFDIVRFQTDVTVQWQDLSVTQETSIDLVPDTSIDDEHAAWPGEIAHTVDVAPVPGMPTVEQPSKVGVIQSVNAAERMARIKWAPEAVIQYSVDTTDEAGLKALLTGAVGSATGAVEEVSLYDVEAPAAMNVRRGDVVLVANKTWTGHGSAPELQDMDWLGEIVDTRLDGTLTIRLGAASTIQDVCLRREDVVVAIRSDGTDEVDDWQEDDAFENMMDEEGLAMEQDGEADDFDEEFDDEEWEEAEEGEAVYEDENGQPMDEDEVENEDWESADEDRDEEMPDLIPQSTPPTSTSATPPEASKPDAAAPPPQTSLPNSEPPQYLILDTRPPTSPHYATQPPTANPAHTKRVQKDHRILAKPSTLPEGVYIRTWEHRLDLLRALIIGPAETPYADAPFLIDFFLPPQYPVEPPQAFFHSWPAEPGLGGAGRVNPNLYEDGKICLSLLGTWEGSKGEGWNAGRCTLLQVVVSLLGLVLVREPYFNEAGYEHLAGLEASRRPSALYSERILLRARGFVVTALQRLREVEDGAEARGLEGFGEVLRWVYWAPAGPRVIEKVGRDLEAVLRDSEAGDAEPNGLTRVSKGVGVPLKRALERLRGLQ